ncbi:MAG: DMT family transporter [Burkholderiales bacterium]
MQQTKNPLSSPYLLLSLSSLFWALNQVFGRGLRDEIPPMAFAFWRWAIAMTILTPFALPHVMRQWSTIKAHWRPLLVMGLLGTAFHNALQYVGLQTTTATNGLLLNSCVPIMVIAFSWLFLRLTLTAVQRIGVVLSFIGVICIIVRGDLAVLKQLALNRGDIWILFGLLFWAVYTICLRWRPQALHPLAFLWIIGIIGLVGLTPFYLYELSGGRHIIANSQSIAVLLYTGIFPSLVAFVFWNHGVKQVGPNQASLFLHLLPVFGALLSMAFLNERLYFFHYIGIGLIFTGIYFTTARRFSPR